VQLYFSALSNAPLQYNLKYVAPALLGTAVLCVGRQSRGACAWALSVSFAVVLALCLRVLSLSHYGGQSMWEAKIALPDSKFAGLFGTQERVELIKRMRRSYSELGCADRFFAAVDSLVLPYFVFERRPPFPHAWVARRVPASRDIIAGQPVGCVMMQDRVLPETAPDMATMLGYLRLSGRDRTDVVRLGENIYLIAFERRGAQPRP
jgi:hypothetical protein